MTSLQLQPITFWALILLFLYFSLIIQVQATSFQLVPLFHPSFLTPTILQTLRTTIIFFLLELFLFIPLHILLLLFRSQLSHLLQLFFRNPFLQKPQILFKVILLIPRKPNKLTIRLVIILTTVAVVTIIPITITN